jgi:uncharacterized membrane protein
MPCTPTELRHVPLFSLLDDDELDVLAQQVELRTFSARQRIYKAGDPALLAFVVLDGSVSVSLLDEDGQEVPFSEPHHGDFFGFASLLENVPHHTTAVALEQTTCVEIDRHDIEVLLSKKPMAGLDMLTVLARDIHSAQSLVRERAARNPEDVIDESETFGQRIADGVASFGGSWTFIITFGLVLLGYTGVSIALVHFHGSSWDPYPFILLNLFLSMLASIQAPVIMMSQNRQDARDRLRSEHNFAVNRRAEAEVQAITRKLNFLTDKMGDVEDELRGGLELHRKEHHSE